MRQSVVKALRNSAEIFVKSKGEKLTKPFWRFIKRRFNETPRNQRSDILDLMKE